jgi:hypothetical protein
MKTKLLFALPVALVVAGETAARADNPPVIDGCNAGMYGPRGCLNQFIRLSDGGRWVRGGGIDGRIPLSIISNGATDGDTKFDFVPYHTGTYKIKKAGSDVCMQVGIAPDKNVYMGSCTATVCQQGTSGDRCEWQFIGGNDPYSGFTFIRNVSVGDQFSPYCLSRLNATDNTVKLDLCTANIRQNGYTRFALNIDYGPIPPGDLVCGVKRTTTTDDLNLISSAGWGCNRTWIDHWWAAYDYDDTDWDDGNWGMNDMCNVKWPLARAFNANHLLEKEQWFAQYAKGNIEQLDGENCEVGNDAWTLFGPLIGYTNLYASFFYNNPAVVRSGILVHEARHAAGQPHTAWDSDCKRGGSCDLRYGDDGANSYEYDFLKTYAQDCSQPLARRQQAADRANYLGDRAFADWLHSPALPRPTGPC